MLFKLYKLLWKVTNNRCWLIKCIDILNEEAYESVRRFRNETN